MSDYPRGEPTVYRRIFVPDRVVAILRIAMVVYSNWTYYEAFHARWLRIAPNVPLFEYAPPLGNHLSSQAFGLVTSVLIAFGVWTGRGWAMGLTALSCLSTVVVTLLAFHSPLAIGLAMVVQLPTLVYCALRLNGTFGPPTGAVGRRRVPEPG